MKKYLLTICFIATIASLFTSCKKDDGPDPNQPVITLSDDNISGLSSTSQTVTVTISAPRKIKSLVLTKGVNLQPDKTFGTNGEMVISDAVGKTAYVYNFTYNFQVSEGDKLVGINFRVVDEDGRATEADLTINTTLAPKDILAKYKWRLKDKFWVSRSKDDTQPYDVDNVYTFNADGSMTLDYGTIKDTYDGLNVYDKWSLSDDEKTLTMEYYNVFDPSSRTVETYTAKTITKDQVVLDIVYDLTPLAVFDPTLTDHELFRYTLIAIPK